MLLLLILLLFIKLTVYFIFAALYSTSLSIFRKKEIRRMWKALRVVELNAALMPRH